MLNSETEILNRLQKLQTEKKMLHSHLDALRRNRAIEIRRLYFVERKKQVHIARQFGIKQGSVSRIISGLTYCDL